MQLQNLINYLDVPDSDYWYDSGSCVARGIIDEDLDNMLSQLISVWRDWPESRQEHLAYILGKGTSIQELALIEAMVNSGSEEVVYRAKEALQEFKQRNITSQ